MRLSCASSTLLVIEPGYYDQNQDHADLFFCFRPFAGRALPGIERRSPRTGYAGKMISYATTFTIV